MAQQIIPPIGEQIIYISNMKWAESNISTKKRGVLRNIYAYDISRLKELYNPDGVDPATGDIAEEWVPLWVSEYKDNAGDKIFQPLSSGFPINFYNHPMATEQTYTGGFDFAPIIPNQKSDDTLVRNELPYSKYSPTWKAENLLWSAACYPALPLLIGSSIGGHQHYGPIFLKTIRFSVGGDQKLEPVKIAVEFMGGKLIKPDVIDYEQLNTYDKSYRQSNFGDCMTSATLTSNTSEFLEKMKQLYTSDELASYRIVGMELTVTQEFKSDFTCDPSYVDNDGARFISLTSRSVTGNVTFFSRDKQNLMPSTSQLTMFFGGPFTFPMPLVEWQGQTFRTRVGSGYYHTIGFIARSAPGAVLRGSITGTSGKPVSEFNVQENS